MKKLHIPRSLYLNLILLFFTLHSCESFVDVELPASQLNSSAVFQDYATADAALTNIYSKIRDRGFLTGNASGLSSKLGTYTDEMIPYGLPANTSFNFYYTTILPSNPEISEYWNTAYNQIYAANAIIEGVAKSTNIAPERMNQLTGEALFIRALSHLYLVTLFGDVPYVIETDYRKNSVAARMPTAQVYDRIIKDLEESGKLLINTASSPNRSRPDQFAVKALLARTYLYNSMYAEAANEASAVINKSDVFELEIDLNQVFLLNSSETIWQLQSATQGQNTKEGLNFIFLSGPPSLVALSENLVNSFTSDDLRKSSWIKSVKDGTSIWFHPFKYKQKNYTTSSLEYSIVFRLAEQYLIRAEARARQGDLIGAVEDLNKIRNRAGLQNTTAGTKEELLQSILQERRLEFFSEYGHRFFDLKRFNELDAQLSLIKPSWKSYGALFPIPQNEISTNPYLRPQNPGY